MYINDLKEKIIKIAYFIGMDRKIKKQLWIFKQLEDELDIPKQEIIHILNCFVKAKLFYYTIIPTGPEIEEYDLSPTKDMIENRTGGLAIRYPLISKENIKTIVKLIESPEELDFFIKQFYQFQGLPKIVNDKITWGSTELPMERGHKILMTIFFENPRIVSASGILKKWIPVKREELEYSAEYKNEISFRDALKVLRAKLRKSGLPITIVNFSKNKYILEIKKVDE